MGYIENFINPILNESVKVSALNILRGSFITNLKSFTFDGHVFSPDILRHMANEIDAGTLNVVYETKNMGGNAIYNSTENKLYVGFSVADTLPRMAIMVHELTHAMFDFQARKMDVATSEAIAYIAQCMYARANSEDPDPDARLFHPEKDSESYDTHQKKDAVFVEGWRIAGKVLAGESLDSNDVTAMKAATSNHPEYSSCAATGAGFNGY